jgi:hypothetical protein
MIHSCLQVSCRHVCARSVRRDLFWGRRSPTARPLESASRAQHPITARGSSTSIWRRSLNHKTSFHRLRSTALDCARLRQPRQTRREIFQSRSPADTIPTKTACPCLPLFPELRARLRASVLTNSRVDDRDGFMSAVRNARAAGPTRCIDDALADAINGFHVQSSVVALVVSVSRTRSHMTPIAS